MQIDHLPPQDAAAYRLGLRVAALLREIYPDHRAKRLARDFGISIATAERWLAGRTPAAPHLALMAERWPRRFVAVVFPLPCRTEYEEPPCP